MPSDLMRSTRVWKALYKTNVSPPRRLMSGDDAPICSRNLTRESKLDPTQLRRSSHRSFRCGISCYQSSIPLVHFSICKGSTEVRERAPRLRHDKQSARTRIEPMAMLRAPQRLLDCRSIMAYHRKGKNFSHCCPQAVTASSGHASRLVDDGPGWAV
eukprot:scaffold63586_cov32-Tisochrysis_lutea.AAC.2